MAHFIGYLKGRAKTRASRLGTKTTGIVAHAQGWDIGGHVTCYVDANGLDCVQFTLTHGSNAAGSDIPVATFYHNPTTGLLMRKEGS